MKKLGIVGGLGPMATVYFMELVTDMTAADVDQKHIEIFVHSRPGIPDRTKYILGESSDNPLPMIMDVCNGLIRDGAEVIAIPCITAHFYQDELFKLPKPYVHTLVETALSLKERGIKKGGLMASDGTIRSGLFQKTLEEHGIECVVPGQKGQKKVMSLIYDDVKAGNPINMDAFFAVKNELFDMDAEVILLGCTELSVIKRDNNVGAKVLDVMEVLARATVKQCASLKKEYDNLIT